MRGLWITLGALILGGLLASCHPRARVRLEGSPPPRPPLRVEKAQRPGPPPHAPAYGYRKKTPFRYYPSRQVYWNVDLGKYFWLDGAQWRVDVRLPDPLRLSLGSFVTVEVDGEDPRPEHEAIRVKYPPGQLKKQGPPDKSPAQPPGKAKGKNK